MRKIELYINDGIFAISGVRNDGTAILPDVTQEMLALSKQLESILDEWLSQEEKRLKTATDFITEKATDEEISEMLEVFSEYKIGRSYKKGEVFRWFDDLYRVVQPELIGSAEHMPGSPGLDALFIKIEKPGEENQTLPWEDRWNMEPRKEGYLKDQQVIHNGFTWKSLIGVPSNENYYEPTEVNWSAWEKTT